MPAGDFPGWLRGHYLPPPPGGGAVRRNPRVRV
jgi:hypothetical protein